MNGRLVFVADDGVTGRELWQSDGTADGTIEIADLAPGLASSSPSPLEMLGHSLIFSAADPLHGDELWSLTNFSAWQNKTNPYDVTHDGSVAPIDVLLIINYLNAQAPTKVPERATASDALCDVDGDGVVSPRDALMVINFINSKNAGQPEGEGEVRGVGQDGGGISPVQATVTDLDVLLVSMLDDSTERGTRQR